MSSLPETALPQSEEYIHRYVIPFRPRHLPALRWQVVVVGSGAAGAATALEAADQGMEVLLLRKPPAAESNTCMAQGGIAAAISREDSAEQHAQDTNDVGCGLADPDAVEFIVRAGPEIIRWLEDRGVRFDQAQKRGRSLTLEGGHAFPRVLSAGGDATGKAVQTQLDLAIQQHSKVTVRDDLQAVDLLVSDRRCLGLLALGLHQELLLLLAGTTVLATGGAGQIYRETTNPTVATADGVAMAYRAGATLRDLEFVQFHPTTLYIAGAARVLITEALRGAGAVLIDRDGRGVMEGQHPNGDLAPRDVVSRAILQRMVQTKDTHVFLDASKVDNVRQLFPSIARMCAAFGLDIGRDPIPVRPGAHYHIGGVKTTLTSDTDLPGLLACGEAASTGLHGANRLASNSLLEALVMGRIAGAEAAGNSTFPDDRGLRNLDVDPEEGFSVHAPGEVSLNLDDMLYSLKSLMWRQVGLVREGAALRDAAENIRFWERVLLSRPTPGGKFIELANMLLVSRLLCSSAVYREESRGTHFRLRFPERDDEKWQRHIVLKRPTS